MINPRCYVLTYYKARFLDSPAACYLNHPLAHSVEEMRKAIDESNIRKNGLVEHKFIIVKFTVTRLTDEEGVFQREYTTEEAVEIY